MYPFWCKQNILLVLCSTCNSLQFLYWIVFILLCMYCRQLEKYCNVLILELRTAFHHMVLGKTHLIFLWQYMYFFYRFTIWFEY